MSRLSGLALLPVVPVLASNRTCTEHIDTVAPMLLPAQTVQARKLVGYRGSPSTTRTVHNSVHCRATSQSLHSPSSQARPASAGDTLAQLAIQAEETAVHWISLAAVAEAVLCAAVQSEALFVWPPALPSVEFYPCLGGIDREGLYQVTRRRDYISTLTQPNHHCANPTPSDKLRPPIARLVPWLLPHNG